MLIILGAPLLAMQAQEFGEWGAPMSVDGARANGVNTKYNDGCPIESPDGLTLFLASDRPSETTPAGGNLDIWIATRESEDAAWGNPEQLPDPVNTGAKEFCPTPLPGNRLLFVSTRANNCGAAGPDIYITRLHPVKGWLEPKPLSCDVNSAAEEWSPSLVEAEGRTILFFSSTRSGAQKIYMSTLQPGDHWSPAIPVEELNYLGAQDARPNVRKDGLEIVFDSTRGGGTATRIYTAHRDSVEAAWSTPEPVTVTDGTNANGTPSSQSRASLSRDGERLYFGSSRANQPGDTGGDIFVSTRTRRHGHGSEHDSNRR